MSFIKNETSDYNMDAQGDSSQNQSGQNAITAFLAKLWALVNDSSSDDLIAWDSSGGSFHVYDQARFSREILPRYFKHNNFASFIRQLNMYGFRKISTIEHGSLKNERDDIEFAHPHFLRGQESLLELIKRRAPDTQPRAGSGASSALVAANYIDSKSGRSVEFGRLLEDVRSLQSKQTSLNDKLSHMQTENQALWGEIGSLRTKHNRQQQIVSKLVEFLLQFIANSTAQTHEQSVDQHQKEVITSDPYFSQNQHPDQSQFQTHQSPVLFGEQVTSPAGLKRKHAALMHGDESNKRMYFQQQQQDQQQPQPPPQQQQQQQQQQHYGHPANLGRQQSVTINELSDSDAGAWTHGAVSAASPLIDLVPSPPPSNEGNHHQQSYDYRWPQSAHEPNHPSTTNDFRNLSNKSTGFSTVGNSENKFVPDFTLTTENPIGGQNNNGQPNDAIKTSGISPVKQVPLATTMKEEQIEVPNNYVMPQSATNPIIDALQNSANLAATLYSQNQQQRQEETGQSNAPFNFSLDDITGDVDHIQSSLENIRELIFESLPEGTSIEDLFGDDQQLLLPLINDSEIPNETSKTFINDMQLQESPASMNNHPDQRVQQQQQPPEQQHHAVPNSNGSSNTNPHLIATVNNQLLEQLLNESVKVEEQRHEINKLEKEKSDLEDKIHFLEQQQAPKGQ